MDYFALLGLPCGFALDKAALDAAYFAKQRAQHPDRFATADAAARAAAMCDSAALNTAYRTLKDPLARARYLLGNKEETPDPALLMEAMERREAVEAAGTAQALAPLAEALAEDETEAWRALEVAFATNDLQAATRLTLRLQYIQKAQETVRKKHESFATP